MFHLAEDMHTTSAGAFFKAAGNTLVAHACKAARNQVLAQKKLALPWDDNIPNLDTRNEQDNNARGDKERNAKAPGTETNSNAVGLPVPMPAIERCGILVGLVEYVRDECKAYSAAAFDQPQTFEGYIKYMAEWTKPFDPSQTEKQEQQAMIDLGLLTSEDIAQSRSRQVDRLAAPYKQYGSEILQILRDCEGAVTKENQVPDESWLERLPYWEQLQIIDNTASSMVRIAKQKAIQSLQPRFGVGVDTEELKADAILITKEAEVVKKYRVEFYKLHKQDLDNENLAREAFRTIPGTGN